MIAFCFGSECQIVYGRRTITSVFCWMNAKSAAAIDGINDTREDALYLIPFPRLQLSFGNGGQYRQGNDLIVLISKLNTIIVLSTGIYGRNPALIGK